MKKKRNRIMRDRDKVSDIPKDLRQYPMTIDECYRATDDECLSGGRFPLTGKEKAQQDMQENGESIFDGKLYSN